MRSLTRYLLVELVTCFLVVLAILTLIVIVFVLVKEASDRGLGPLQFLRLVPFVLPQALSFAVPGTILLAVCLVYGRMSGANEIVAIKSLGISPMVVLWPMLIFAFLLSLTTVWLNDLAASWGREGAQRVVIGAAEQIAYRMLRTHRSYSLRSLSMNVKRVDGRKLRQLTFSRTGDEGTMTVRAEEAELRSDPARNTLEIVCRNGTLTSTSAGRDPVMYRFNDDLRIPVPLDALTRAGSSNIQPSGMPLRMIRTRRVEKEAAIAEMEEELAAKAAYQMLTGDFGALARREWETERAVVQSMIKQLHRLRTEPHRRWASGFSCLCFVLVGAPMAIRLRNADYLTSFFLCFLPILIAYYPLLIYGIEQCKNGSLPPYAVWLANGILAIWGMWLLRRVVRF